MHIKIDTNEATQHPEAIHMLETILEQKHKKEPYEKIYKDNLITTGPLECGDYLSGNAIFEHKTMDDYRNSVKSGRIFAQAQDMLYNVKLNPGLKAFVIVSNSIVSAAGPDTGMTLDSMIEASSSLSIQLPVIFASNQILAYKFIVAISDKCSDGKQREYNPVRLPIQYDDHLQTFYCSIPGIGKRYGQILAKHIRIPSNLLNVTKEYLIHIGLSDNAADKLLDFIHARSPGESTEQQTK